MTDGDKQRRPAGPSVVFWAVFVIVWVTFMTVVLTT